MGRAMVSVMDAKTLIDELGHYTVVARKIGVAPGVVATWRSRNAIPKASWPDLMTAYPRKASLLRLKATAQERVG
jgi:hypothetical protein